MSRTIQQIKKSIEDERALQSDLASLNSPSQTAIYNLWEYLTASAIWVHEKLWDIFKAELEAKIAAAPVGTVEWVQTKTFEFQYDATTPQIVQLVDYVPSYSPVDETKRIITRASVKTLPNKIVSVKVAKSEPPVPLDAPETSSLQGYLDDISFAGVQYDVSSTNSDKLFVSGDIYYNGQYASVISANTITAIQTYMATIPFDGYVRVSSLEDAIQQVEGVTDIVLDDVSLRVDSIAYSATTSYLVQNKQTIYNKYGLFSGYVEPETTSGATLSVSLNFITEQ